MKKVILYFILIASITTTSFASLKENDLLGKWSMKCTQTQIVNVKGYLVETYTFFKKGKFNRERHWFKDSICSKKIKKEVAEGSISIGKENTNNGLNPSGTYEVKFKQLEGIDLGLLWIHSSKDKIRISRGMGKTQNTMLGLFEYIKQ